MSVRLGLVGVGAWGKNFARTVSSMSGVSLSGVFRSSNVPFSEAKVFSSFGELLSSCDGVIIATPPDSHEALTLMALAAGKPVLLEKPVALDLASVQRIFAASERAGVPVLVDHIHLFSPAFSVMREWTSSWSPRIVSSVAGNRGPVRSYPSLYDWGPHDVAMCLSLFQRPPDGVESTNESFPDGTSVDELHLGFGESRAVLRFGNGMQSKVRVFSVVGPDGASVYDDLSSDKLTFKGRPVPLPKASPLEEIISSFASCVSSGKKDWRYEPWIPLEVARILDYASTPTPRA